MESILNSFGWGHQRHKLDWHILKNSSNMGGTSLPDLQEHYIAAQLSHMYHYHKNEMQRYNMLVSSSPGSSLTSPLQAIFRGGQISKRTSHYNDGMLLHHQKNMGKSSKEAQNGTYTFPHPLMA